jgi:hypothetical protein
VPGVLSQLGVGRQPTEKLPAEKEPKTK